MGGLQDEVEAKAGRRCWRRQKGRHGAAGKKTERHDSGAGEQRVWHRTPREQSSQVKSRGARERERRTRLEVDGESAATALSSGDRRRRGVLITYRKQTSQASIWQRFPIQALSAPMFARPVEEGLLETLKYAHEHRFQRANTTLSSMI